MVLLGMDEDMATTPYALPYETERVKNKHTSSFISNDSSR